MEPSRNAPQDFELPAKRPRNKLRICLLCLCCILIGFLFGVGLDMAKRPNIITFYLDNNSKLSLQPQKNDIIRWTSASGTPVQTKFISSNKNGPCAFGSTKSTCIYDPSLTSFNMDIYGCTLGGTTGACSDPLVGPKSVPGMGTPQNFIDRFLGVLIFDLLRFLGVTPHLSDKKIELLAGSESAPPPTTPKSITTSASAKAGNSTADPLSAVVLCNGGKPVVQDQDENLLSTIKAFPGEPITWYPQVNYAITGLDSICDYPSGNGISSAGSNQTCQIKSSATPSPTKVYYIVSTNGTSSCGNSGAQDFAIVVVAPPQ